MKILIFIFAHFGMVVFTQYNFIIIKKLPYIV